MIEKIVYSSFGCSEINDTNLITGNYRVNTLASTVINAQDFERLDAVNLETALFETSQEIN
jgi:hypothetical protein